MSVITLKCNASGKIRGLRNFDLRYSKKGESVLKFKIVKFGKQTCGRNSLDVEWNDEAYSLLGESLPENMRFKSMNLEGTRLKLETQSDYNYDDLKTLCETIKTLFPYPMITEAAVWCRNNNKGQVVSFYENTYCIEENVDYPWNFEYEDDCISTLSINSLGIPFLLEVSGSDFDVDDVGESFENMLIGCNTEVSDDTVLVTATSKNQNELFRDFIDKLSYGFFPENENVEYFELPDSIGYSEFRDCSLPYDECCEYPDSTTIRFERFDPEYPIQVVLGFSKKLSNRFMKLNTPFELKFEGSQDLTKIDYLEDSIRDCKDRIDSIEDLIKSAISKKESLENSIKEYKRQLEEIRSIRTP